MASARKIPDWEWDFYQDQIKNWYLKEGKTIKQVMERMEQDYNFHARYHDPLHLSVSSNRNSKAQYVRQFNKWSLKKNSTQEDWEFIADRTKKRKLEGKESAVYIDGSLTPIKKLRKEISRYDLPSWKKDRNLGM
jgi:hypothetical protein